mmetsp:Transcript_19213/g.30612  ORF Transcript_19213/g.30612 Transcript_19213/m.30612 type:complete len:83 (-) Transcript_19213:2276-2524(-)
MRRRTRCKDRKAIQEYIQGAYAHIRLSPSLSQALNSTEFQRKHLQQKEQEGYVSRDETFPPQTRTCHTLQFQTTNFLDKVFP